MITTFKRSAGSAVAFATLFLVNSSSEVNAQTKEALLQGLPPVMTTTSEQDHQRMLQLLGISSLRPAPSSDVKAAHVVNTDESKANPYPNLPDPLVLKDGRKVENAEMWWNVRRPEIVEDFNRDIYGRVPENLPRVT